MTKLLIGILSVLAGAITACTGLLIDIPVPLLLLLPGMVAAFTTVTLIKIDKDELASEPDSVVTNVLLAQIEKHCNDMDVNSEQRKVFNPLDQPKSRN
jgi:hypothetical protein